MLEWPQIVFFCSFFDDALSPVSRCARVFSYVEEALSDSLAENRDDADAEDEDDEKNEGNDEGRYSFAECTESVTYPFKK